MEPKPLIPYGCINNTYCTVLALSSDFKAYGNKEQFDNRSIDRVELKTDERIMHPSQSPRAAKQLKEGGAETSRHWNIGFGGGDVGSTSDSQMGRKPSTIRTWIPLPDNRGHGSSGSNL